MKQLELQLSGFDIQKLIERFQKESRKKTRWYDSEVIKIIKEVDEDQQLIEFFRYHIKHYGLFYSEDIIALLEEFKEYRWIHRPGDQEFSNIKPFKNTAFTKVK